MDCPGQILIALCGSWDTGMGLVEEDGGVRGVGRQEKDRYQKDIKCASWGGTFEHLHFIHLRNKRTK